MAFLCSSAAAAERKSATLISIQSVPINITGSPCSRPRCTARASRAPRSPSPCALTSTPRGISMPTQEGEAISGVTHNSTGPTMAPIALDSVPCNIRRANLAAPSCPSAGMSRVLAKPGRGALAKIIIRVIYIIRPTHSRARHANTASAIATSAISFSILHTPPNDARK